ncbi:MAG: long-chain fatty acid--CoA ligase [FCB group bacterium]|nr:long-chain fatty acid--CoA ligase [FCB group bacterium]
MYASTIAEMFVKTTETFPDSDLLFEKIDGKWEGISGSELFDRVKILTLALKRFGAGPGINIGILSPNSPTWTQCDFAIACTGAASVGIFHSLVPHHIEYILNDSGLKLLFIENSARLQSLEVVWEHCSQVERFVVMQNDYSGSNPKVVNLAEFAAPPKEAVNHTIEDFQTCIDTVKPKDLLTIFYTSGTTGSPKGVMLSHQSLIADLNAALERVDYTEGDRLLSVLPLSYALERMAGNYMPFYSGCAIYYSSGHDQFQKDIHETQPTILISVPYIIENLYNDMQRKADSQFFINRILFRLSKATGIKYVTLKLARKKIPLVCRIKYSIWRLLVYRKLKKTLGGKIKFIASGGAALTPDIAEYFYSIGIPILEGYGLTEAGPILTINTLSEIRFGTVGRPLSHVTIKIAADGEILVKTPSVMMSYYENEEDTRSVFDKQGWFHTGDFGKKDADGFITITGRKKNILITSSGKAIAPAPLEKALIDSPFIEDAVVVGDNRKFISAILLPDFENIIDYLDTNGVTISDPEAIIEHSDVTALFNAEIKKIMADFSEYERVKKYILITRPFPHSNGDTVDTVKVRRQKLLEAYHELIDELYKTDFDREGYEI